MKGIEKITARIQQDAQAEREAVLQEARQQADAIRADFQAQAQAAAAAAAEKSRTAAAQRLERLESAARMDARKQLLAAKQDCVQAAFDRALERLQALPEAEYIRLLAGLAAGSAQTGREELILSPADRARVGGQVTAEANRLRDGAAFTLSDETREMAGGLILRDGSVEINCAFETRLRLLHERMAADVAGVLFS